MLVHRRLSEPRIRKMAEEKDPAIEAYDQNVAYAAGKYEEAAKLFERITTDDNYVEFLTLPAYELID